MSTLQDAITKLKIQGFEVPPDIGTIQKLTGLGADEKMALLQASRTGALPQVWGPSSNAATATMPQNSGIVQAASTAPIPQAALQQRDTTPAGGPSAAADYYSEDRSEIQPRPAPEIEQPDTRQRGYTNTVPGSPGYSKLTDPSWQPNANVPTPWTQQANQQMGYPGIVPGQPTPVVNNNTAGAAGAGDWSSGYANTHTPTYSGPGFTPGTGDNIFSSILNPLSKLFGGADDYLNSPHLPDDPTVQALQNPDYSGLDMPGPINFKFVNRDFSKQGQQMAADAFAPQYEAIEGAKQDETDQYNTSDVIMSEMNKRLTKELQNQRHGDVTRYDQQVRDQKVAKAKGQQDVADTYNSSNDLMAKVLKQVSSGSNDNPTSPEAAAILASMAQKRAVDQTRAADKADERIQSTRDARESQSGYDTSMINANQLQGNVNREGFLRDLHTALSGLDQQRLGYKSQERQDAQQLADQLFGRDQDFQKTEYGQLQGDQQNAWNQYNAGVNQINGQNSVANQNISNQNAAAQNQYENDTSNYWNQVKMDYQQTQDGIANGLAAYNARQKSTGGAASIDNLGPMGVIKTQIANDSPGASPTDVNNAFQSAVSFYGDIGNGNYKDMNDFIYQLITKNPGIPQEVMRSAGMAVWAGMNEINAVPAPKK